MEPYIVAEIGVNHNGNLEKAIDLIDEAKSCGCNGVKFQSFKAERLVDPSTPKVEYQLRSGSKEESHFEMIKKLEFNGEKLSTALEYAEKLCIDFITTPYDVQSMQEAYQIGVRKFKTASADLCDIYLHKALSQLRNVEIIIATGMSTFEKIKSTLSFYEESKIDPIILHCVSDYPCSDASLNLSTFDIFKSNFKKNRIGFSDHSVGITAAIVASSIGYDYFERHFTLDKNDDGPDHFASSDVKEMKQYIKEIKRVNKILGVKEKKLQKEELNMSNRSKKGIKSLRKLYKGEIISLENTYALRPAENGISIDNLLEIIGKKVKHDIASDQFIQFQDLI